MLLSYAARRWRGPPPILFKNQHYVLPLVGTRKKTKQPFYEGWCLNNISILLRVKLNRTNLFWCVAICDVLHFPVQLFYLNKATQSNPPDGGPPQKYCACCHGNNIVRSVRMLTVLAGYFVRGRGMRLLFSSVSFFYFICFCVWMYVFIYIMYIYLY